MKKPLSPKLTADTTRRYTVKLTKTAQKQLDKLPDTQIERIKVELLELASNPRPSGVKKLKGQEGYRIRFGDYRIMYSIFDDVLLVEVVKVGQRGNFYNK
ncbi:hypothetical protein A0257_08665 [Hymenobacter psoromatis]|nr:hypothetical protein A0257_08665 [Hymenobacter psoromatis]